MDDDKLTYGMFVYYCGDIESLGARWPLWLDRFKIYLSSAGITDAIL